MKPLEVKLDRMCLVLEAFSNKECREEKFQQLLATVFSVASEDKNIDNIDHLLRSALKKYKFAQIANPDAWTCLAQKLVNALDPSKYAVSKTVSLVSGFIEVALDVNLGETCESEEICDSIEFLKIFLTPKPAMKDFASTLKKVAMLSYEIGGTGNLEYFKLKKKETTCDVGKNSQQNYEGLLWYRKAHLSSSKPSKDEGQNDCGSLENYTNWLHLAVGLTQLFFAAYPICAKLEDISLTGR